MNKLMKLTEYFKQPVVTGILTFGGENLIYVKDQSKTVEQQMAEMTKLVARGLARCAVSNNLSDEDICRMGSVAQGILSSPHDNLKRAQSLASKNTEHDMYYYFALACYKIVREMRPINPDDCKHEMQPEPGCPNCDEWLEQNKHGGKQ